MNKHVFSHRNKQISFGYSNPANLSRMTKMKRLFEVKLYKQNTYYKDLVTALCLLFSVFYSVSVFGQTPPDAALKSKTNVNCFGGNDGSIEVKVLSGSPVYRYSIFGGSPYQYSAKFVNLYAGSYVVTVTDTNGLSDTVQVTVSEPTKVKLSVLSKSMISCNSMSDGIVNLSATGGTTSYSYKLGSGTYQSSINFSNLSPGTSKFFVLDANSCRDSLTVIITEPAQLTLNLLGNNVKCNNGNDGKIVAKVLGGTRPYRYRLGSSGTYKSDSNFNNLVVGTYTVQVLDTNNCATSKTLLITQPTVLNLTASVSNPVCIQDKTGAVTLSVSGGTSSFTYRLDSTFNAITKSFVTTSTYSNLYEGKYSAEVKDANGCLDTVQIIIEHFDAVKPKPIPRNILTVYLGALGSVNVSANMSDSVSSDNCGIASLSISKTTFNCSNIGYNTVKFKIVDVNSNSDSINFIVNVKDTTRPKITTRNFTVYLDASGLANLSIDSVDLGSTDACGSVTRTLSKASFNCLNKGLNTVTYSA